MAELTPYPLPALASRMFRELERHERIYDLPRRKFFLGDAERDLSVTIHGRRAATPFGPAAGPHTQLAQNLVLGWLGGGRIFELKTVQENDRLTIPRPCIDMQTVGYNVEWSQELRLEESLEEYVKGAMLICMLRESGRLGLSPDFGDTVFDMSVGYDLRGIQGPRVAAFIRGLLDARPTIDRLRGELTGELRAYRDLDYPARLSDTLTLSTFHGCPPQEIEQIVAHLMREHGLHCVVKLNPTLLGQAELGRILHEILGYSELRVPDSAFASDTTWAQAEGIVERLGALGRSLGLGLGVKFTNTLIVENHRSFFSTAEKVMYLSGPPLHVLAIQLVDRFRQRFGDAYPVSFSAGIDRANFAEAVALGLAPVTVCSDLLQPGGYGRARGYFEALTKRMAESGSRTLAEYTVRGFGRGAEALAALGLPEDDPRRRACAAALGSGGDLKAAAGDELFSRWVSAARLENAARYAERVLEDPRYGAAQNQKPPKKVGRRLQLFDCLTCDKCIPVCPNHANFAFDLAPTTIPLLTVWRDGGVWQHRVEGELALAQPHQIGTFHDFCNECGNCDVFCPEDGGPYVLKPRFFGTEESYRRFSGHDGFWVTKRGDALRVHARFRGTEYTLERVGDELSYGGPGFALRFEPRDLPATLRGDAAGEVDLSYGFIMDAVARSVLSEGEDNYVATLARLPP